MSLYNNGFPYGYTPTFQPAHQQTSYITWIEGGENAAKSYMLAPNTILPLWDTEKNRIYVKSSDEYGKPSMKILEYKEVKSDENRSMDDKGYVTKDDLDTALAELSVGNGGRIVRGNEFNA